MASRGEQYAYDAILFHREDKIDEAECLCSNICEYAKQTGRPLTISTFDSFCSPAKQELQNLHDAVEQAKYIICMEDYYDESFKNTFFADAACQDKQKRSLFILLKRDQPVKTEHPTRDCLQGSRLISCSEFYANDKEKLVKELSGRGMIQCTSLLKKDTKPSTRTYSSSVPKPGEHAVLHNEVVEDAHPDNTPYHGSQVFPPARCHEAKGQNLAEKSAHSKQPWGVKRNTKNLKDVDYNHYTSDTVILHTDDETALAQSLSEDLQEHAKQTGRNLRVQLFRRVSHPGKQEIRNLNETLTCTKNIICSPAYYRQEQCNANVALKHKMKEHRFFLMYVESKAEASVPFKSMEGIQITHNWQFVNEGDRDKLVSRLCGVDGGVALEDMAENESKYTYSVSSLTNSAGSLSLSSQTSADDSSLTERKVVCETSLSSTDGTQNEVILHASTASLPGSSLITDSSFQDLPTENNDLQRFASALVGFPESPGRDESIDRTMETSGTLTAETACRKMYADGATPSCFPSDMQRRQIPDGASIRPTAAVAPAVRNQAEQGSHIASTPNEQLEVMRNVDRGDGYHPEQVQRIPYATAEQLEELRNFNDGQGILLFAAICMKS